MKTFTALAVSALAVLPYVSAHGFVNQLVIDGKTYAGNVPNASPKPSVIRQITDISPVKGASNKDLNCGINAKPASLVADAQAGSDLEFSWLAGGGQKWPHNTGPVMTYLASCGNTACNDFDSTKAKWFKIDEAGQDDSGVWAQAAIMQGKPFKVTLPNNLAAGNYLVRHEIIALHLATSLGGAEFYPSCSQLKVGGNGNGVPPSSDLVSFPGGYSDQDPGIFDPNVFNPGANYTFPGPPLVKLATGGSNASSNTTDPSPSASATQDSSNGAPTPSAKQCKPGQKKRMVKKRHVFQWSH
ncbi:glycoside hydrolase family 61 protein [Trametopsis cervina]|nr:glycoside hydrolase family 61 protein [Trametopsis cervina]